MSESELAMPCQPLWSPIDHCIIPSALLDRIVDLERASRPDSALATRRGTERDSRLRERLLPALNEPLLEVNPYSISRHCGPEVAQKHNYLAAQQLAHYEQGIPKTEHTGIQREIIKLPKSRSRPSKTATPLIGSGSGNVVVAAPSSSNSSLPFGSSAGKETDAQQVSTGTHPDLAPAQRTGGRMRILGEGTGEGEGSFPLSGQGYAGEISRESIMD